MNWHVEFISGGSYYEGMEHNIETELEVTEKIRSEYPNAAIQVIESYEENPQHDELPIRRTEPRSDENRRVSGA